MPAFIQGWFYLWSAALFLLGFTAAMVIEALRDR